MKPNDIASSLPGLRRRANVLLDEGRVPDAGRYNASEALRVLCRLALEQGTRGTRYHAVGEEGVALKAIAEKVTVLCDGAVLAEGTLDEVQADERVIEVYLGR